MFRNNVIKVTILVIKHTTFINFGENGKDTNDTIIFDIEFAFLIMNRYSVSLFHFWGKKTPPSKKSRVAYRWHVSIFNVLRFVTGKIRMLGPQTCEICMLAVITSKIRKLVVITGKILMLGILTSESCILAVINGEICRSTVITCETRSLGLTGEIRILKVTTGEIFKLAVITGKIRKLWLSN